MKKTRSFHNKHKNITSWVSLNHWPLRTSTLYHMCNIKVSSTEAVHTAMLQAHFIQGIEINSVLKMSLIPIRFPQKRICKIMYVCMRNFKYTNILPDSANSIINFYTRLIHREAILHALYTTINFNVNSFNEEFSM